MASELVSICDWPVIFFLYLHLYRVNLKTNIRQMRVQGEEKKTSVGPVWVRQKPCKRH